jgi:hypothetical protein
MTPERTSELLSEIVRVLRSGRGPEETEHVTGLDSWPVNDCVISPRDAVVSGNLASMRSTVAACMALLISAGCGGSSGPASDRDETLTASASPDRPIADESSMPPSGEEPEPDGAGCLLVGSHAGEVQIVDVGNALMVTWHGLPVAATGTTGYYVTVYDAVGNAGQLGVKYLDGKQIAYFSGDLGSGQNQANLEGRADRDQDRSSLVARFPKDVGFIAGGGAVKWSAAYTLNGTAVGTCPETGGDTLRFPG